MDSFLPIALAIRRNESGSLLPKREYNVHDCKEARSRQSSLPIGCAEVPPDATGVGVVSGAICSEVDLLDVFLSIQHESNERAEYFFDQFSGC